MSTTRIFPKQKYRQFVRPIVRVYAIAMLLVLAIEVPAVLQEMQRAEFLRSFDPKSHLLPVNCEVKRGVDGQDYVRGYGRRIAGRGILPACWYTLATFKRNYPELSKDGDEMLIERSFQTIGIRKERPSLGRALFGIGFAAVVLAFLSTGAVVAFLECQDRRKKS